MYKIIILPVVYMDVKVCLSLLGRNLCWGCVGTKVL